MKGTRDMNDVKKSPGASPPHRILQPPGWPRPRGYANGITAEGRLIFTGGLIGWNAEHLVRLTWYVTSIEQYLADPQGLGAAYREIIGKYYPAMATVEVTRLVEPKALVEIEATAVIP
jgi:hypothetical protein